MLKTATAYISRRSITILPRLPFPRGGTPTMSGFPRRGFAPKRSSKFRSFLTAGLMMNDVPNNKTSPTHDDIDHYRQSMYDEVKKREVDFEKKVSEFEIKKQLAETEARARDLEFELKTHKQLAEIEAKRRDADFEIKRDRAQLDMDRDDNLYPYSPSRYLDLGRRFDGLRKLFTLPKSGHPEIFGHPAIAPLIDESTTNPVAMDKLMAIVRFKLNIDSAIKMVAIPDDEFSRHYAIINQCNKNSLHYGVRRTFLAVEFCNEQLFKPVPLRRHHYEDLVRIIFDTGDHNHINPYNRRMSANYGPHKNSIDWGSDYNSGNLPKFTPELKIFFKTPNIADNTWIQCSGPGTVLWDIDPNFKLLLGSLCDPNGKGKFTSEYSIGSFTGTQTSPYQISFKWE